MVDEYIVRYKESSKLALPTIASVLLLLMGVIATFSPYGRKLGIVMLVIFVPLTIWLIVKARTSANDSRVLLKMDEKGLTDLGPASPKGHIPWSDIRRASVYMGRQLELELKEGAAVGGKKAYVSLDLSPVPADVVARKANEFVARHGGQGQGGL